MVVSLGPGKFYGTSLPRPRFYSDVKFNDHRVDPPLPVSDPFMSWAQEAHWSMGGLSFTRLRLQGKIEGNVNKLRSQREKFAKAHSQAQSSPPSDIKGPKRPNSASDPLSPSPPPAPFANKRRRVMAVIEDEEENEAEEIEEEKAEEEVRVSSRGVRRRLVKKLDEDFDRVASENEGSDASDRVVSKANLKESSSDSMGSRTRSRRLAKVGDAMKKVAEEVKKSKLKGKKSESEKEKTPVSGNRVRSSPRLAKRGSN